MSETKQEVTQHLYSLRDIVELLVKQAGIHEGQWTLSLGIQIGVGQYGPTPDQTAPGAAVTIVNIGIQKHPVGAPIGPSGIVVDAAIVNPAPRPTLPVPTEGKKARVSKRVKADS